MDTALITEPIIEQYELKKKVFKGYVYMQLIKGMDELPQSNILTNKLLEKILTKTDIMKLPIHLSCGSTSDNP